MEPNENQRGEGTARPDQRKTKAAFPDWPCRALVANPFNRTQKGTTTKDKLNHAESTEQKTKYNGRHRSR